MGLTDMARLRGDTGLALRQPDIATWKAPYETSFRKLAADSPISSVISLGVAPLARAAAGAVGNATSIAVTPNKGNLPPLDLNSRYTAPAAAPAAGIRSATPAPAPRMDLNSVSRMSDGTFPGQAAFMRNEGAPSQAALAPRATGIRRAASATPTNPPFTMPMGPLQGSYGDQGEAAPTPEFSFNPEESTAPDRGYIEQGGVRMYVPGSKAWDGTGSSPEALAQNVALAPPPVAAAPQTTTYGDSTGVYQLGPGQNPPPSFDANTGSMGDLLNYGIRSRAVARESTQGLNAATAQHYATTDALGMMKAPADIALTTAQGRLANTNASHIETMTPAEYNEAVARTGGIRATTAKTVATTEPEANLLRMQGANLGSEITSRNTLLPGQVAAQAAGIRNIDSEIEYRGKQGSALLTRADQLAAANETKIITAGENAYTRTMAATQNPALAQQAQADAIEGARAAAEGASLVPGLEPTKKAGGFLGIGRTPATKGTKGVYVPKGTPAAAVTEYKAALAAAQQMGDQTKIDAITARFQEKWGRK